MYIIRDTDPHRARFHQWPLLIRHSAKNDVILSISTWSAQSLRKTHLHCLQRLVLEICRSCPSDSVRNAQIAFIRSGVTFFIIVDVDVSHLQTRGPAYLNRSKPYACTYSEKLEQEGSRTKTRSIITLPTNVQQTPSPPPVVQFPRKPY